ncbi:hypothetical protein [Pedobacter chitinilyticus]|nr:hypothetical protein [Pedobacter chitinilyticus]
MITISIIPSPFFGSFVIFLYKKKINLPYAISNFAENPIPYDH